MSTHLASSLVESNYDYFARKLFWKFFLAGEYNVVYTRSYLETSEFCFVQYIICFVFDNVLLMGTYYYYLPIY